MTDPYDVLRALPHSRPTCVVCGKPSVVGFAPGSGPPLFRFYCAEHNPHMQPEEQDVRDAAEASLRDHAAGYRYLEDR